MLVQELVEKKHFRSKHQMKEKKKIKIRLLFHQFCPPEEKDLSKE